jgi:hypothetical protein
MRYWRAKIKMRNKGSILDSLGRRKLVDSILRKEESNTQNLGRRGMIRVSESRR